MNKVRAKLLSLSILMRASGMSEEAAELIKLSEKRYHTVSSGENVDGISKKYDVSSDEIISLNNLAYRLDDDGVITNVINLQLGQQLELPPARVRLNINYSPTSSLLEWMKAEEGGIGAKPIGYPSNCDIPKRGEPYLCSYDDGKGNLTIGWGRKQKNQNQQTITLDQANALLVADLASAAKHIVESITSDDKTMVTIPVKLENHQLDALTSLIFNGGRGGFKKSPLYKDYISLGKHSAEDPGFKAAFLGFRIGSDQGGLPGRRGREFEMFSTGTYTKKQ